MTAAQLAQAIKGLAGQIKVRSTSPTVDGWADQITALAGDIPTLAPTINERRKAGERRRKDTPGSLMRRIGVRRGGVNVTVPPVVAVIETLDITSANPPTFEPPNTHQLTWEFKDRNLAVYDDRAVTFATSDGGIATVSATGLVTAVGVGAATITVTGEGLSDTAVYTVTTPVATVTSLTLSSATLAVSLPGNNVVSAIPKDASNNTVLNQTITWSEVSGAGDVSLSADSGPETHQVTVTGVTAGTRVIRATHAASGVTADCTVTVTAVVSLGFTDALGINHPNCPSDLTPIHARLYGTSKPDGGTWTKAASYNPYYTGYTEGFDDMGETGGIGIRTDPGVPFQTERALLYPGAGARCAWGRLVPGAIGSSAWASTKMFHTTSTSRPNAGGLSYNGMGLNQVWRRMYWSHVFKLRADYPALDMKKLGFFGAGGQDNTLFVAMRCANNGSMTSPITPMRINLQGSNDKILVAAANGTRLENTPYTLVTGTTNGAWGQGVQPANTWAGSQLTSESTGGVSVTLTRGVWYRLERLVYMNTNGVADGWIKIWLSSWNGTTWSTPVAVNGPNGSTGLVLQYGGTSVQGKWHSVCTYYQHEGTFAGTGRFARSSNFDIASTLTVPYDINNVVYSLPSGTVCDLGTSATIAASQWGVAKISANAAGALTATWFTNGGAGYVGQGTAVAAMGLQPPASQEEVAYVTVQASASGWTAGTDALQGGTGGTPATTTNYSHRSGVHMGMEYVAGSTT